MTQNTTETLTDVVVNAIDEKLRGMTDPRHIRQIMSTVLWRAGQSDDYSVKNDLRHAGDGIREAEYREALDLVVEVVISELLTGYVDDYPFETDFQDSPLTDIDVDALRDDAEGDHDDLVDALDTAVENVGDGFSIRFDDGEFKTEFDLDPVRDVLAAYLDADDVEGWMTRFRGWVEDKVTDYTTDLVEFIRDEHHDILHENVEGSQHVIYTHLNFDVLRFSRSMPGDLDEPASDFMGLAYQLMMADASEDIHEVLNDIA